MNPNLDPLSSPKVTQQTTPSTPSNAALSAQRVQNIDSPLLQASESPVIPIDREQIPPSGSALAASPAFAASFGPSLTDIESHYIVQQAKEQLNLYSERNIGSVVIPAKTLAAGEVIFVPKGRFAKGAKAIFACGPENKFKDQKNLWILTYRNIFEAANRFAETEGKTINLILPLFAVDDNDEGAIKELYELSKSLKNVNIKFVFRRESKNADLVRSLFGLSWGVTN